MTWRWLALVLTALLVFGCAEATVRPFVDKADGGIDAPVDAGEEDGGDDDDGLDGGEDDGGDEDGGEDDLDGEEDGADPDDI